MTRRRRASWTIGGREPSARCLYPRGGRGGLGPKFQTVTHARHEVKRQGQTSPRPSGSNESAPESNESAPEPGSNEPAPETGSNEPRKSQTRPSRTPSPKRFARGRPYISPRSHGARPGHQLHGRARCILRRKTRPRRRSVFRQPSHLHLHSMRSLSPRCSPSVQPIHHRTCLPCSPPPTRLVLLGPHPPRRRAFPLRKGRRRRPKE